MESIIPEAAGVCQEKNSDIFRRGFLPRNYRMLERQSVKKNFLSIAKNMSYYGG
jgi:hypothetical protein